ncbi:uncharacterized protein METZ01_LOCUS228667, partial [marine metagenome]
VGNSVFGRKSGHGLSSLGMSTVAVGHSTSAAGCSRVKSGTQYINQNWVGGNYPA